MISYLGRTGDYSSGPRMRRRPPASPGAHHGLFLLLFLFWRQQSSWVAASSQQNAPPTSLTQAHQHMSPSELRRIFHVKHHSEVPDYEVVKIHSVRRVRRRSDGSEFRRVQLESSGGGGGLQLRLDRVRHLVPSLPDQDRPDETDGDSWRRRRRRPSGLKAWYADGASANVSYTEAPEDNEDVGDVYQDVDNQAAILMYRDREDDALLMEGTIGDELVVKPISAATRRILHEQGFLSQRWQDEEQHGVKRSFGSSGPPNASLLESYLKGDLLGEKRFTDDNDDYAFLDEDENLEDEDVMVTAGGRRHSVFFNGGSQRKRRHAEGAGDHDDDEDSDDGEEIRSDVHIIYRRKDSHLNHESDYNFMESDHFPTKSKRSVEESRQKRQAPYIIFPEILCIVDYDGYRLHGKDNIAIKRYVISFWNGIDLRYKLLKGPSVKISIAGIIISRGRDATPYLERNRVGRDAIDSASALTDMGKYLFLERRLPVYDIAVAITKLDMCRRKSRLGECNRGTAGFAYVGGACVVNKRLEKVNSVAIVEDTGGFSGIIVAAHELGHLLGAVHDGSPPPSYLGGPGARKCRWEDGFIMSDLRHTSKGFAWSHCTVLQFRHFLNGETATCMYNSPHEDESLPRVLPGKLLSLDAQCRKDRGTSACFKDDRVCAQLFCFDAGSGYCVSYRPAAEGSRCGDGFLCLNGKCVPEHENAVDFSGDGFLRRSGSGEPIYTDEKPSRKWWNNLASKSSTTTSTTVTTSTTTVSTTTRLPWWKRIQRPRIPRKLSLVRTTTSKSTTSSTASTSTSTTSTTATTTSSSSHVTKPTKPSHSSSSSPEPPIETVVSKPSSNSKLVVSKSGEESVECEDRISNIAGSMSCSAFLQSFAYQYCRHAYIRKNCCAAHKRLCTGLRLHGGRK